MANTTPIVNTSGDHTYNVSDGGTNNDTSLTFIGRNSTGYTQIIGENFLHLLENFASPASNADSDISSGPRSPVKGQIWYNSINNGLTKGLRVYDGTSWIQLGVIKKAAGPPTGPIAGFNIGDFYIDTLNKQLYIYTDGSKPWVLIGPTSQVGDRTNAEVYLITDAADNSSRPVLALYNKETKVAIVSNREFTPKTFETGFPVIKQGINLSTIIPQTNSKGVKFWGISEKAESLIVGDTIVAANNFLRSDQTSITKYGFNVRNDSGLLVGTDLSLSIGVDNGTSVFYNKNVGSRINFKIQKSSAPQTILTIDAGDPAPTVTIGRVGINNTAPTQSLDVVGNIITNSALIINPPTAINNTDTLYNDSNAQLPNRPSIATTGGAFIAKSLSIGKSLYVNQDSTMSNILPKIEPNALNSQANLGSQTNKWNYIWSNNITATTITGDVTGNLTGTADVSKSLAQHISITFTANSDVTTNEINLNTLNSPMVLNGKTKTTAPIQFSLNSNIIFNKDNIDDFSSDDLLLVSGERSVNGVVSNKLFKITKNNLIASLPCVPIGSITIWAGDPNKDLPSGYIICDGGFLKRSEYPELFSIIGNTYTPTGQDQQNGVPVFKLPNLSNDSTSIKPNLGGPLNIVDNNPLNNLKFIIYTGRIL